MDERDILQFIRRLLSFPYPQICRHLVVCDLLSIMENKGMIVHNDLAEAVCQSDDDRALGILNNASMHKK